MTIVKYETSSSQAMQHIQINSIIQKQKINQNDGQFKHDCSSDSYTSLS